MASENGQNILLVDDDKHLLVTLTDYLEFEGFQVMQARSAEEALRRIKQQEPDLVVLDIGMPGIGGMGFLKRIACDDKRLKYPVIVLTARLALEGFFSELDIQVDGFFTKPCPAGRLVERIRELLAAAPLPDRPENNKPKRILLVEDDPRVSFPLQRHFEDERYDVVCVTHGAEVLERASTDRFDIIVMKEILPGMNGSVIAVLLERMQRAGSIPVLLYDDTRTFSEDIRYRRGHPGVTRMISTAEPVHVLNAVREVLYT